ncbi:MAG: hypothetical protein ABIF71_09705 [Planctomycetota bacterium]
MFEVTNCAKCGAPVTPENRRQFATVNGQLVCPQCKGAATAVAAPANAMAAVFDKLYGTAIIQKRPAGPYANAHSIPELIDAFEQRMNRRGPRPLVIILAVAAAVLITAGVIFALNRDAGAPVPVPAPGQTPPTAGPEGPGPATGPEGVTETPATPAGPVTVDAAAEADINRIKTALVAGADLLAVRTDAAAALAARPHPQLTALLAEIDNRLANEGENEMQGLLYQVGEMLQKRSYQEAEALINGFVARYGNTRWYRDAGRTKAEALLKRIRSAQQALFLELMAKAEALVTAEQYPEAYGVFELALPYAPADQVAAIRKRMAAVVGMAGKLFGEQGLQGYLAWQKYRIFRKEYLNLVRLRDFDRLQWYGQTALAGAEFQLIIPRIQADMADMAAVGQVMNAAARSLGSYVGKSHSINTQAGKITGIVRSVDAGLLTVSTSDVDITIPISKLAVDELTKMAGETTGGQADFHIGLGILYLADGNEEQARGQFGIAAGLGTDITRYQDHIKALRGDADETGAATEYKKNRIPDRRPGLG